MFTDMDWWTKIRLEVLRGESTKREILRREGIHWETLKKILEHSEPPGYRMKRSRPKPKIDPYLQHIAQIIEEDNALPKKQRHTAKRIYERMAMCLSPRPAAELLFEVISRAYEQHSLMLTSNLSFEE